MRKTISLTAPLIPPPPPPPSKFKNTLLFKSKGILSQGEIDSFKENISKQVNGQFNIIVIDSSIDFVNVIGMN